MLRRLFYITLAVLALSGAAAGSAQAIMLVSQADEIAIGKEVEAQAIKEYGGLSADKALQERVVHIGDKVAAISFRKGLEYTYKALASNVINAFAAPGGPVLITQRLARMLNDDELAFVLAHETGHIAGQHGRRAISKQMLASGIAVLVLGRSSRDMQFAANVVYTLYSRGYSRGQETQADHYGLAFMRDSGYNPEGAVTALAKLGMERASGLDKYLSTHPDTPSRVDALAKLARIDQDRKLELIKKAQAEVAAFEKANPLPAKSTN